MNRSAIISPCGSYRYSLTREWESDGMPFHSCYWIMLNPSTADAEVDDPTIRRVVGFSKSAGYRRAVVLNLFALRATDPRELLSHHDPIGPDNDSHLSEIPDDAMIVAGWGQFPKRGRLSDRSWAVRRMFANRLFCLGTTKNGAPRHPVRLPAAQGFEPFERSRS